MYRPLVTVVVPVFNVEQYLKSCLDSIIKQTYENLQIICVNDGSTDGSLEILTKYKETDPRVTLINQENQGLSVARNTAIKITKGELILFVDSDDAIDTRTIESLYPLFHDKDVDLVCFGYQEFSGQTKNILKKHYLTNNNIIYSNEPSGAYATQLPLAVWTKMFRVSFLKNSRLEFVPGLLYEDIPFYWECISRLRKLIVTNDIFYFYRIRTDSIMGKSRSKASGMAIHHLYGLDHIYEAWSYNGYMTKNKKLFQFLFERYVRESCRYLNAEDIDIFRTKTKYFQKKWGGVQPRRFSFAHDFLSEKKPFKAKYRIANSIIKRINYICRALKLNYYLYPVNY